MARSIEHIMADIRAAGLIYDPVLTAMIINYEAGHLTRNCFYANMTGPTEDEQQLKRGWIANVKVELSDLVTQARILAEIYGWNWQDIVSTGEAKLEERIDTYKQRGVRPNEALMQRFGTTVCACQLRLEYDLDTKETNDSF